MYCIFTIDIGKSIFDLLYAVHTSIVILSDLSSNKNICSVSILEDTHIVTHDETMAQWFHLVGRLCKSAINICTILQLLLFWIHGKYLSDVTLQDNLNILTEYFPSEWILCYSLYRATHFGDVVNTCR